MIKLKQIFTIKSLIIFLRTLVQDSAVETTDFKFFIAKGFVFKSAICLYISSNENNKTENIKVKTFYSLMDSLVREWKI